MRIIFTGTRKFEDEDHQIIDLLPRLIKKAGGRPYDITVVHGQDSGVNSVAGVLARSFGCRTEHHLPDWRIENWGPRNQRMVDLGAALCVAYPREEDQDTPDMIERCVAAGIPVLVWDRSTSQYLKR